MREKESEHGKDVNLGGRNTKRYKNKKVSTFAHTYYTITYCTIIWKGRTQSLIMLLGYNVCVAVKQGLTVSDAVCEFTESSNSSSSIHYGTTFIFSVSLQYCYKMHKIVCIILYLDTSIVPYLHALFIVLSVFRKCVSTKINEVAYPILHSPNICMLN